MKRKRGRPPLTPEQKALRQQERDLAGAELKALRQQAGLSQVDLGALVGASKGLVWAWENGTQPPVWAFHACLAELLPDRGLSIGLPGLPGTS